MYVISQPHFCPYTYYTYTHARWLNFQFESNKMHRKALCFRIINLLSHCNKG